MICIKALPGVSADSIKAKRAPSELQKQMQKNDTVRDLLQKCMAEKQKGADFPSIWNNILKRHPLVLGAPVQVLEDGEAKLSVPLITGQGLVYGTEGFSIAWAPDAGPISRR